MKKISFWKLFPMVIVVCVLFVSCDKEGEISPADPVGRKAIKVEYSLDVSEELVKFFDVIVSYGVEKDTIKKTIKEDWLFSKEYNGETSSVFCHVDMTLKKNVPAFDESESYRFKAEYSMSVESIDSNDKVKLLNVKGGTHPSISIQREKMQEYFGFIKDHGYSIDFSFDIE